MTFKMNWLTEEEIKKAHDARIFELSKGKITTVDKTVVIEKMREANPFLDCSVCRLDEVIIDDLEYNSYLAFVNLTSLGLYFIENNELYLTIIDHSLGFSQDFLTHEFYTKKFVNGRFDVVSIVDEELSNKIEKISKNFYQKVFEIDFLKNNRENHDLVALRLFYEHRLDTETF